MGNVESTASGRLRGAWLFLPVLFLLLATLPHLGQGDFRRDSARYAALGLQMWEGGSPYEMHFHPSIAYYKKPPLAIALHGAILHTFGVSLPVSRIGSILAALGTVVVTCLLARRYLGEPAALASGVVLALTYEFFRRCREVSLDHWMVLFLMLGVFCWLTGEERKRVSGTLLAGFWVGLALLCKPVVGLLWPLIWFLGEVLRKDRAAAGRAVGTAVVAVLVALIWYGPMLMLHGTAFVESHFAGEITERLAGAVDNRGAGYYGVLLLQTYWPWLLLLGLAGWFMRRTGGPSHEVRFVRAMGMAALVWFLFLTLIPSKAPNYALPLYPLLAMVAGWGSVRWGIPVGRLLAPRAAIGMAGGIVFATVVVTMLPIRFQSGPHADYQAWFAFMEAEGLSSAQVWEVPFRDNESARFYLYDRQWAHPLTEGEEPPPGAILFYHDGGTPGPGEEVIFQGPKRARATRFGNDSEQDLQSALDSAS